MPIIIFLVCVAILGSLLWMVFNSGTLTDKKNSGAISKLAKMSRQAKRHDSMLRYHEGIPFVITHQTRGFVYMVDGATVNRETLIKRLGLEGESKVEKVEQEEQMTAPSPTRMTVFSPDIKAKPKSKAKVL